ncbi:hypothetical protein DFH09DRAFT_1314666 [Mycena vulgaris]|nr:hypothetical protein DFH09DRAFT_1314666 [Mycena vulgaris]
MRDHKSRATSSSHAEIALCKGTLVVLALYSNTTPQDFVYNIRAEKLHLAQYPYAFPITGSRFPPFPPLPGIGAPPVVFVRLEQLAEIKLPTGLPAVALDGDDLASVGVVAALAADYYERLYCRVDAEQCQLTGRSTDGSPKTGSFSTLSTLVARALHPDTNPSNLKHRTYDLPDWTQTQKLPQNPAWYDMSQADFIFTRPSSCPHRCARWRSSSTSYSSPPAQSTYFLWDGNALVLGRLGADFASDEEFLGRMKALGVPSLLEVGAALPADYNQLYYESTPSSDD